MKRILNDIRSARLRRTPALGQRELGEKIGASQSDVSAYELGKVVPTLPKAIAIAKALGASVEEVFWQLAEEAEGEVRA